ncbi:hypothetical protein [Pseudomonas sp. NPDC089569]|uniref:hypothetical protein n=1 Tax=Pseudomonas sp. NPDC089569 TaxID=3390722 RepID=UPI003CFCD90B
MIEESITNAPHLKTTASTTLRVLSVLACVCWVALYFYFEIPFDSLLWGEELKQSSSFNMRFLAFGLQIMQICFVLPVVYLVLSGRVSLAALYGVIWLSQGPFARGLAYVAGY